MIPKQYILKTFLFCLSIISSAFFSCTVTNVLDKPCSENPPSIYFSPSPGSTENIGTITYKVNFTSCADYANQYIWLYVKRPNGLIDYIDLNLGTNYSGSAQFPYTFTQIGKYSMFAAMGPLTSKPGGTKKTPEYSIEIIETSDKNLKIQQLQTTGNYLWPSYAAQSYFGENKRDQAFGYANTNVLIVKTTSDLTTIPENVNSNEHLLVWTITSAGGDVNKPDNGLDPNIVILCSLNDVSSTVMPNLNAKGFAVQRFYSTAQPSIPAMGYVLFDRIKNQFSDEYDRVRIITGATIHELGHTRGITGDDDASSPINPSHSGNYSSTCIMRSPINQNVCTNPRLCDGHNNFIKGITW